MRDRIPANGSRVFEYVFLIDDDFAKCDQFTFVYHGIDGQPEEYLVKVETPLKVVRE